MTDINQLRVRTASITNGQVDIAASPLLFRPWIYKVAIGAWATTRERLYLQMFIGLN